MSFGVLTLATQTDYLKAIGLALSMRVSNPGVSIAVACPEPVRPLLEPYFDIVVLQDPKLKGFVHKLYLDHYSPYEETFFFDSDILILRPLSEVLDGWRGQPYRALGGWVTGGFSSFGQDRDRILKKIGKEKLVCIDGAGHAYFKKPECTPIFELARRIVADYDAYAGPIRIADEDVINIAMTILDYTPYQDQEFFSRHLSAVRGTLKMNVAEGVCQFVAKTTGRIQKPHMMHFAAREVPFFYSRQLAKIYRKFGVSTRGLLRLAISDFYLTEIKWNLSRLLKRVRNVKK